MKPAILSTNRRARRRTTRSIHLPVDLLCRAFRCLDNDGQYHIMGAFRSLRDPKAELVLNRLMDEVFSLPNMWPSRQDCLDCIDQLCDDNYFTNEQRHH